MNPRTSQTFPGRVSPPGGARQGLLERLYADQFAGGAPKRTPLADALLKQQVMQQLGGGMGGGPGPQGNAPIPPEQGDATYLGQDVYAALGGHQTELVPRGLMDRLFMERKAGMPAGSPPRMTVPQSVPTTRNRF